MVSHITNTDRCQMPTPSLPALSLRRRIRLPARRARLSAANDLICLGLWSICGALLRARSHFLPALREGGPPAARSVDREVATLSDSFRGRRGRGRGGAARRSPRSPTRGV